MKLTLILALTAAAAFAQGPLTPPGAPAPSGKSLTEIYDRTEKRTPISSLPFNITQGGSYYLTQSLSGAGQASGITISVSNVTLDLNGFTLDGSNIASPAIATVGGVSQVTVRNGHITLWNAAGLDLSSAGNVAVEKITVRATGGKGIRTGYYSTVSDCRVDETGDTAFEIGSQSSVRDCIAGRPNGAGFDLATDVNAEALVVYQTLGVGAGIRIGAGGQVRKSVVRGAAGNGVVMSQRSSVHETSITGCGDYGIYATDYNSVERCRLFQNANGGVNVGTFCDVTGSTISNHKNPAVTGVADAFTALRIRGNGNSISQCALLDNDIIWDAVTTDTVEGEPYNYSAILSTRITISESAPASPAFRGATVETGTNTNMAIGVVYTP